MYLILLFFKEGKPLTTIEERSVFGELALLYNCKRTATVTAATEVQLWEVERKTYMIIAMRNQKKRRKYRMQVCFLALILFTIKLEFFSIPFLNQYKLYIYIYI